MLQGDFAIYGDVTGVYPFELRLSKYKRFAFWLISFRSFFAFCNLILFLYSLLFV